MVRVPYGDGALSSRRRCFNETVENCILRRCSRKLKPIPRSIPDVKVRRIAAVWRSRMSSRCFEIDSSYISFLTGAHSASAQSFKEPCLLASLLIARNWLNLSFAAVWPPRSLFRTCCARIMALDSGRFVGRMGCRRGGIYKTLSLRKLMKTGPEWKSRYVQTGTKRKIKQYKSKVYQKLGYRLRCNVMYAKIAVLRPWESRSPLSPQLYLPKYERKKIIGWNTQTSLYYLSWITI